MTIPEAVQLVLRASVMPEAQGRIAMLKMGEPVKMLELAKNLIRLSGLALGVDADIAVMGLRPGEKLHEELRAQDESEIATGVEKIRLLEQPEGPRGTRTDSQHLVLMESVLQSSDEDDRLRSLLVALVLDRPLARDAILVETRDPAVAGKSR